MLASDRLAQSTRFVAGTSTQAAVAFPGASIIAIAIQNLQHPHRALAVSKKLCRGVRLRSTASSPASKLLSKGQNNVKAWTAAGQEGGSDGNRWRSDKGRADGE